MGRSKSGGYTRKTNTRDEKKTTSQPDLLTFSFKDFDFTQPEGNEQTFESWATEGLLAPLFETIRSVTQLTRQEATGKQQIIKVYKEIPDHSDFYQPKHINDDVHWAVLKGIGGQKCTLAGYIVDNTFYAVFLDKDHRFWPTEKKNT